MRSKKMPSQREEVRRGDRNGLGTGCVNTEAQLVEEKPWKNDELRNLEEALPPLR